MKAAVCVSAVSDSFLKFLGILNELIVEDNGPDQKLTYIVNIMFELASKECSAESATTFLGTDSRVDRALEPCAGRVNFDCHYGVSADVCF